MILPAVRDPRFVTIRRGGTLTDADHHLLALWAAACAEHVLPLFESAHPGDQRPRQAIEHARAWVRGETSEGRRATRRTRLARPGRWLTSPPTNSARPPMRSRRCGPRSRTGRQA